MRAIELKAFILPKLGEIEAAALTADKIRKWHADLTKTAPRLRTRDGEKQKHRPLGDDDERSGEGGRRLTGR